MIERTRTVSWRMPEDLYNQVVRLGVAEGRTISSTLQVLVKVGLKEIRQGRLAEKKGDG